MVINGIGGNTIAQAKRNLSYDEVMLWAAYREQTGSLNVGQRVELSSALVAQQVNWAVPRKAGSNLPGLEQFLPKRGADAESQLDQDEALQQAMREW